MRCALVLVGLLSWWPAVASASPRDDFLLCRNVIAVAEHSTTIPERLLSAIAVVESGRRDPGTGSVAPWPWTINVEGVGHVYDSKAAAIAAVQEFQARGVRSIDVGCMQINLLAHPSAFGSLDEAFDPVANARYAARFLSQLYQQTGTWLRATAGYHSLTPEIGDDYARKVLAAWPKEREVSSEPPDLCRDRWNGLCPVGSPAAGWHGRTRVAVARPGRCFRARSRRPQLGRLSRSSHPTDDGNRPVSTLLTAGCQLSGQTPRPWP